MRIALALLVLATIMAEPAWARDEPPPDEARARMEVHLKEVNRLAQHFDGGMGPDWPRFGSRPEATPYVDAEIQFSGLPAAHRRAAPPDAAWTDGDDAPRA